MKSPRSLCALLVLPALLAGSLAMGARPAPQDPVAGVDPQEKAESELEKQMVVVEDGVKALRRSTRDPSRLAESLATLATVQAAALASKQEVPAMAARVPEGERSAFVSGYRKEMVVFLTRLLELETALLDGEADAIKAAYRIVYDMEDSGHERFTEDG